MENLRVLPISVSLIGHGQSTDTKKGDMIDKMSKWIFDILKTENIIAKNSSCACEVYAEIFLFAFANHLTEKSAFNN